jgi:hypothetical protein
MESKQTFNYEHVFNFEEKESKSQDLVKAHGDLDEVIAERKIEMDGFNQRQKEINKTIFTLCNELREGKTKINGECVVKYNEDLTHIYVFHPDTGAVIFDRDLDLAERAEVRQAWEEIEKKKAKGKKTRAYVPPFLLPPIEETPKQQAAIEAPADVIDTEVVEPEQKENNDEE